MRVCAQQARTAVWSHIQLLSGIGSHQGLNLCLGGCQFCTQELITICQQSCGTVMQYYVAYCYCVYCITLLYQFRLVDQFAVSANITMLQETCC